MGDVALVEAALVVPLQGALAVAVDLDQSPEADRIEDPLNAFFGRRR